MQRACPNCGSALELDHIAAGQDVRCPICQHVIPAGSRAARGAVSGGAGGPWTVLTIVAAALLLAAMFLPWWSIRLDSGGRDLTEIEDSLDELEDSPEATLQVADALVPHLDWYAYRLTPQLIAEPIYDNFREYLQDLGEYREERQEAYRRHDWRTTTRPAFQSRRPEPPDLDIRAALPGWRTGTGMGGLMIALLALGLLVFGALAPPVRRWLWIGQAVLAAAALIACAMGTVFIATCPGEDVDIGEALELSQGLNYGFIFAAAGLALLLVGLGGAAVAGARRLGTSHV